MKKAFSLAEMIISLGVVGILYLILVPIFSKASPNADTALIRKAYNITENTVYNLINDDVAYPNEELGFADTTATAASSAYSDKFCYYFLDRLNTIESDYNNCTAQTSDGISWKIIPNFVSGSTPINDFSTVIKVTLPKGKVFDIKLRYDGKMKVDDSSVIKVLKNPTNIK
jgi:competence protein ComGC